MKIHNKLFLILFSFSFILITGLVLVMQWSIGQGMVDYVNAKEVKALQPLASQLAREYQKTSSWKNFEGENHRFFHLIRKQLKESQFLPSRTSDQINKASQRPGFMPKPRGEHRPPMDPSFAGELRLPPGHEAHYALLDNNKQVIAGLYKADLTYRNILIYDADTVVGFIAVSKRKGLIDGYELDFLEQQTTYLWLIALAALLFTLLITFLLARHLVGPVKQIAQGMHHLSQGDYQYKLELDRHDELGQLSEDYNTLALTLARNEEARKRWLANTSHELRTPITILMGELEAMLLGVRPLTVKNISSANDEALHLKRLIDDLHMLNSAELGGMHFNMQPLLMDELFRSVEQKYVVIFNQHNIEFVIKIHSHKITLLADKTRLMQLFDNILMNAVHYAQCSAIQLTVQMTQRLNQDYVEIKITDNGVGVDDQHLSHLFEYLYRVDDARNRQQGGSGLGLSLCQHIVQSHQGEITAINSPLGGLGIIISLPVET
ncbi:ATP-binding protein [Pseudoalteromonas sp. Ld20]|uniref:ATP-binding protein n=1 Tax=Pseudoalteromonas sp. Ld20 TaxID=649165 RepID=UPI0038630776